MDDKTFQDLVKEALEVLKERTVIKLMEHDLSYQESIKKHGQAEKRYLEYEHIFTAEQKEIINEYLDATAENNTDMNDLLYIAGLRDMLHLLISYNMINPQWVCQNYKDKIS